MTPLQFIGAAFVAYLIGAFPTGVVATRLTGAPDVRYSGSKHTGGTNAMRLAGLKIGVAVVIIDGFKGLIAWAAAFIITLGSPYALPLAGTMATIGHCWPIYTRFHGGMGLATGGGLMFVMSPVTIIIGLSTWAIFFIGVFKKNYSPRCVIIGLAVGIALSILLDPMTPYFNIATNIRWMLVSVGSVLIIKHLPEWNRIE